MTDTSDCRPKFIYKLIIWAKGGLKFPITWITSKKKVPLAKPPSPPSNDQQEEQQELTELMVLHSLAQFSFYVCKKVTVILEGQT